VDFSKEIGKTARMVTKNWSATVRLCALLMFSSVAAAVFMTLLLVFLPALYGHLPVPQLA
jgi:hypothetical protein